MKNPEQSQGVSRISHYAVLASLLISNLTVLGLGMLFAGPFMAGSMGSIYFNGELARAHKASAATLIAGSKLNKVAPPSIEPIRGMPPAAPLLHANYQVTRDSGIHLYFDDVQNETQYRLEFFNPNKINPGWLDHGSRQACAPSDDPVYNCVAGSTLEVTDYTVSAYWPEYPDFMYRYRVVAVNYFGETPSNEITVVPFYDSVAPDAPRNFRITSQECKLSNGLYRTFTTYAWDPSLGDQPGKGAVGGVWHKLYLATPPHTPGQMRGSSDNIATTYTDINTGAPTTFERWVVAVDANENESAPSTRITVTVPLCPGSGLNTGKIQ
jgi:hypothetical protein